MKCDSVQCLWSPSPPSHNITATAVLEGSQSIYTGGSDGSIIWWRVYSSPASPVPRMDVKPMTMLCGHSARIADLDICTPIADNAKTDGACKRKTMSAGSEALISVCIDGVLCIWSGESGHCRRRRKLPSWTGSPFAMSSLYKSRRYVCIGCMSAETMHLSSYHSVETDEGGIGRSTSEGFTVEREVNSSPISKGTVVIVDACTLNIIHTVIHGFLSIGPVQAMVVAPLEEKEKQLVIMADGLGRFQSLSVPLDHWTDPEDGISVDNTSSSGMEQHAFPKFDNGINGVSIAPHGKVIALIFSRQCLFRSTTNGLNIGEIYLGCSSLCDEDSSGLAYLTGGMFFSDDKPDFDITVDGKLDEGFADKFVVWNNRGAAMMYHISYSSQAFKFECLCEVPAASYPAELRFHTSFCQLNEYTVRTASICFDFEQSLLWTSQISIWSPCQLSVDEISTASHASTLVGEGGLWEDWYHSSDAYEKYFVQHSEDSGGMPEVMAINDNEIKIKQLNDYTRVIHMKKGEMVTSSMVLSDVPVAPYAVVDGFYNGQIKVTLFDNYLKELRCSSRLIKYGTNTDVPQSTLLGHTGAILCLAFHRMSTPTEQNFEQVLISGSMDCTVRVWNLDTGTPISVFHHHIAPVRQIILPPPRTYRPWSDCFMSVGDDGCVALISLDTLCVERMFPGHPDCPKMVAWDSARGYIASLIMKNSLQSKRQEFLYIWDVKTGARERIIRGPASQAMFDNFSKGVGVGSNCSDNFDSMTSASSLFLNMIDDRTLSVNHRDNAAPEESREPILSESNGSLVHDLREKLTLSKMLSTLSQVPLGNKSTPSVKHPLIQPVLWENEKLVKSSCPCPGVAALVFDLHNLMSPRQGSGITKESDDKLSLNACKIEAESQNQDVYAETPSEVKNSLPHILDRHVGTGTMEKFLLWFSIAFLHLWGTDALLDQLLVDEMDIYRPEQFLVAPGLCGDKGSLTLVFPGRRTTLEASSEFVAMRSLIMVSLAQRMLSLSHPTSDASSALAAFYTRNFAERVPDIKPPLLQLLASFWQDQSEHVRMAARSLFHCAASRAIPVPLCGQKASLNLSDINFVLGKGEESGTSVDEATSTIGLNMDGSLARQYDQTEDPSVLAWLESYELHGWVSIIGGTNQDARASHIIVAAALAVWYPSLVKPSLAASVVHQLVKLVMVVSEKYSATAAELLAEGMDTTWKPCIGSELSRLIGDLFFLIECLSGTATVQNPVVAVNIRDTLIGILLPSLAMADIVSFLSAIEGQTWATSSDSPVHVVSLMTLIRVVRGAPKLMSPLLDKVVNFILLTMDLGNSVMRQSCLHSSMAALKEVARVFPMVALNQGATRLAVGDLIGDVRKLTIEIYDLQNVTKIKVLDASGPPGLPSLLRSDSDKTITAGISVLSFSPDGEGLVAFSEHGLMIRWWSLGAAWWEKLTRNTVPVQCTKLILIPPWEAFSPNSSRSSIMASIHGLYSPRHLQDKTRGAADVDCLKALAQSIDLSYRLEWEGDRKVVLFRHGQSLGSFQL
ncbi:WD repeat-containing protein 7 [Nymphaea thermarum]|nr:WD repeat-containing protein 7 [Nymphaea thermarum]